MRDAPHENVLRPFGPCWDAAGTRGYNKEGWWFHRHYRRFFKERFDFTGCTPVGKTTTLPMNAGNMPIMGAEEKFAPLERFPKCIWFSFLTGETINSVSLSGPGFEKLATHSNLLKQEGPFMGSFMSIRPKKEERLEEFRIFCAAFVASMLETTCLTPFIWQVNISCPNTGLDPSHLVNEATEMLDIAAESGLRIVIKLNLFAPPAAVRKIGEHPACAGVCSTNALPFDEMKKYLPDFHKRFRRGSPLRRRDEKFGGGGYSGEKLLPYVAGWWQQVLQEGYQKPCNALGGIRHPDHVDYLVAQIGLRRSIDSISIASAAMVRPWQVQPIIRRAHKLLG